ncbi:hypothetical protein DFH29DRAFT_982210 [Suillus ampliporus]|nr:hypothetical protein DFH29DRAFT_982210 [Suillus ampliporus]
MARVPIGRVSEIPEWRGNNINLNHIIYAFFRPVPTVEYVNGCRCHTFQCATKHCKVKSRGVRRFLDTTDAKLTSNMRKHAKKCWSNEVVASADKAASTNEVCNATLKGTVDLELITAAFERKGKGKVTFSHRHKRPFNIVSDWGFQSLMKTGRPEYHILSPATVSHNVKKVFANTCKRIAKMLQEHDGALSFATDTWTSPNHKAFVAVTVHLEHNGVPICLLLDVVEVAMLHLGVNLVAAFAWILEEFGISNKVSLQT